MGTEFFWFFDILIAGIFVAVIYKCTRQGFASGLVSFAGMFLPFILALALSLPVAGAIYDGFVSPGVNEKIAAYTEGASESVSETSMMTAFTALQKADISKAFINGKSMNEFKSGIETDSSGKVDLDLVVVDLSGTGIAESDLGFFGITDTSELNTVNLGKLSVSKAELNANDIEDIILARAVSQKISEKASSKYEMLDKIINDTVPGFSKAAGGGGGLDMVAKLLVSIIHSESDSLESAINGKIVRPMLIVPIRALVFTIIFVGASIAISLIAKSLRFVNRIPLLGALNSFLGLLLGIVQALVVVFLVCIGFRIIISLTANGIIFLNTMTIDETFIFKHIYYLDILKF
ncbi:MAG: CvpA family protein [Oscillospiraceae bacterium]|nr:CvpA family protein [Oscillospiraceae bacterium]